MSDFKEYISSQRINIIAHLRTGYREYAIQMYQVLIQAIEEGHKNKTLSQSQAEEIALDIKAELEELRGEGFEKIFRYLVTETALINSGGK